MGVVDIDELRILRGSTFNMDKMKISAVDLTWHGEDATVTISFNLPPDEAKALLHKARDIMFNNRQS